MNAIGRRSEEDLEVTLEYTCPVKSKGRAQDDFFSQDTFSANSRPWSQASFQNIPKVQKLTQRKDVSKSL